MGNRGRSANNFVIHAFAKNLEIFGQSRHKGAERKVTLLLEWEEVNNLQVKEGSSSKVAEA